MGTERKRFYEDRGEIRVTKATIKQRLYAATRSGKETIFVVTDCASLRKQFVNIAQKILYLINTKTVGMSTTVDLDLEVSRVILVNEASLNKD